MMSGESGGQDFDLNLAPIIDCFTVLITYLLVSASFITLSVFDVGVAATGVANPNQPTPPPPKDPPLNLALNLLATKRIDLKLTGGPKNLSILVVIEGKGTHWDLVTLQQRLDQVVNKFPTITEANLSAESNVAWKDVVKIVELVKKTKKVFLAE